MPKFPKPKRRKGRTFKRDRVATKEALYLDKRSYVSFRKHPGADHNCVYLKGADVGFQRLAVYQRDGGKCWNCGAWYGPQTGHMDHIKGGAGAERCFCLANLRWSCPGCHRARHVQVRWMKKEQPNGHVGN